MATLFAGCPGDGRGGDAGPDANRDALTSCTGGTDPNADSGFVIAEPAFAPRLVVDNPDVVCAPLPPLAFAASPRSGASPGDLRWTYRPASDPAVSEAYGRISAGGSLNLVPSAIPMTGLTDGGASLVIDRELHLGFSSTGSFSYLALALTEDPVAAEHYYHSPAARVGSPYDLVLRRFGVASALFTDPPWILTSAVFSEPGGVAPTHPDFDERVADSMPAVFPDRGVITFVAYPGLLTSNCLSDGRVRWVLEYDPALLTTPTVLGLTDGSVVANLGGMYTRVSIDGAVMASRPTTFEVYEVASSPDCGVLLHGLVGDYVHPTIDYLEWWSLDDFATTAHLGGFLVQCAGPSESVLLEGAGTVTSACQTIFPRARGTFPHGHSELLSIGLDADTTWAVEVDAERIPAGMVGTDDGGFIVIDGRPGVTRYDARGHERWSRSYDPTLVGSHVLSDVNVFMPDGTLYFVTVDDFTGGEPVVVAIETGARPGWQVNNGRTGGGSWARLNAPLP